MQKLAGSPAVPLPARDQDISARSPMPTPDVTNKPAPGLKGPAGLSPRTSYSKVNSGTPPVVDTGAAAKAMPPDAMGMLSPKVAHAEVHMGTMTRQYTINELLQAAAAGAMSKAASAQERFTSPVASEKTASVATPFGADTVDTPYALKLADAIGYIAGNYKLAEAVAQPGSATKTGPGMGPNATEVQQAQANETAMLEAGQSGEAKKEHQTPMDPPMQTNSAQTGDPGTGMKDNSEMQHPAQPEDPMGNDRSVKSAAQRIRNMTKAAILGYNALSGNVRGAAAAQEAGGTAGEVERARLNTALAGLAGGEVGMGVGALTGGVTGTALGAGGGALVSALSRGRINPAAAAINGAAAGMSAGSIGGLFAGDHMLGQRWGRQRAAIEAGRVAERRAAEAGAAAEGGGPAGFTPEAERAYDPREKTSSIQPSKVKWQETPEQRASAAEDITRRLKEAKEKGLLTAEGEETLAAGYRGMGADYGITAADVKTSSVKAANAKLNALVDAFIAQTKVAEDAINPAQISSGNQPQAEPPPGASASEEHVPSEPADVVSQKSMISSTEAAINYTKRQAKADPKSDANKLLTEPAQSKSTDKVLHEVLEHTDEAGAKISHATKQAAARALLLKLAEEAKADAKKKKEQDSKEKESMGMGGGFSAPSVGGAAGGM